MLPAILAPSCARPAGSAATPGPGEGSACVVLLTSGSGPTAPLDVPAERGVRLAFDLRAARPGARVPALRIVDAAGTPDGAARAAREAPLPGAANAGACAVAGLGFCDTDLAIAAVPAFAAAGVPFMVIGATDPGLPARCGAGTFLACFGDDLQGRAAAEFMRTRFGPRLAIVFDSRSTYARTVAGFCRQRFRELQGGVPAEFDLAATPPAQLGAFMTDLPGRVDALYVACEPPDVGPVLASVRPVLPKLPIVGGDSFDGDSVNLGGGSASGGVFVTTHAWFGEGATAEAIAFAGAYRARWGEPPPSAFAALGFDAANIVLDAFERVGAGEVGGSLPPAAIRAELVQARRLEGASGCIGFDRGPVPDKDVWIFEVVNGVRVLAERVRNVHKP